MRRLLMATSIPFWRKTRGSEQRIAALIDAIEIDGWDVSVFFLSNASIDDRRLFAEGCSGVLLDRETPLPDDYYIADPPLSRFTNNAIRAEFLSHVRSIKPYVALIQYIELAYLVDDLPADLRRSTCLAIDTHDVMHQRCARFASADEPHWVQIDRNEEAKALRKFDLVIAIQDHDALALQSMAPDAQVITAHHAVVAKTKGASTHNDGAVRFGFLGVGNAPNIRSATFLLKEVWPQVYAQVGDEARLVLAGAVCAAVSDLASNMHGVEPLGEIDSIATFYDSIDVVLNPVTFGGGLKIKNVEALAHGVPLVTTATGSEGLGGRAGDSYLLADSAETWARECLSLTRNASLRQRIGNAGQRLSKERFHPDTAYSDLFAALSKPYSREEVAA